MKSPPRLRLSHPLIAAIAVLALAANDSALAKRFTIIVNAEADEEYMAKSETLEHQTYHFVRGEYFGGGTRDRGLETAEFNDIAESVAAALRKRRYYPESDKALGDLMIMISWGRTSLDPDYRELMGMMSAGEMVSAEEQDRRNQSGDFAGADSSGVGGRDAGPQGDGGLSSAGIQMLKSEQASQKVKNIRLLGLAKDLNQTFNSELGRDDLWGILEEERYFIVLNAFDYQHLLQHGELKQVWSARYSTRAVGLGFKTAYESMNHAVSGVLGLRMDKLANVKGDTRSSAEFGEVEVIEERTGSEAEQ